MDFPESRPTLKRSESVEYSAGKADVFVARHREAYKEEYAGSLFQWLCLHVVLLNGFSGLPERR